MGSSASISNRNNRKLQRTGKSAYKMRMREFIGRDIRRSKKPLHDQYDYSYEATPVWQRVLTFTAYLFLAAVFVYVLAYHSYLN